MVAFCGNLLGAVLTFQNGKDKIYSDGYRMKKEETGAYEERFLVSVDGEEAGNLYVQIPEKETGQTEEAQEEKISPEEERVREIQEAIAEYNQEKEEAGNLYVQIPEKETGQTEEAQEEKISPEEERVREIQEAIAEYNQEKEDEDYYYLPEEWEGKHFIWEQKGDGSGTLMASLFLIAGAALMVLKSREEFALIQKKREQMLLDYWEQKGDGSGTLMASLFLIAGAALMVLKSREEFALIQKKREQMLLDYPGLIMKFTLLVQAGMTARKAFQKIAGDYRKRKNKKERYAYEEILVVCYEMDSGVSEAEAYRRFGERCGQVKYKTFATLLIQNLQKGQVKYKTFATLLIQNLQKGSRHLEDMLERESADIWKICWRGNQWKPGKNGREKRGCWEKLQPQNFWDLWC